MWGQSPQRPCEVSRVATTFGSPGMRAEGSLPGQLPGFSYQWLHHTLIDHKEEDWEEKVLEKQAHPGR